MRALTRGLAALVLAAAALGPAPAATGEGGPPRSFTIAAAGDVLMHSSTTRTADQYAPGWNTYDFAPLMAAVEPWIAEADLAVCHMEVVLSPDNTGFAFWPRFRGPHEMADSLAATGFDVCTTASNHSLDFGLQGLADTLQILQDAGLRTTGTARTEEERLPLLYDANGVTVGWMAYSYGQNGWHQHDPWSVNYIDAEAILDDAAWLRDHGAEFVVLSMHWGNEYRVPPSNQQVALAEELLPSPDIDLILGHHVHVVQPIQKIGDEYVVYGMSNFYANINTNPAKGRYGTENGIIVTAQVAEQPDGSFAVEKLEYTPIWMNLHTKELLPAGHALLTGAWDAAILQRNYDQTVGRVNSMGQSPATPTADPWPAVSCRGKVATVLGTGGDDVLVGTDGDDVIVGRGGDDSIWAGGGDDLVCSGDGDDFVSGGDGGDRLEGGGGDDVLMGYGGDDVVWAGDGGDVLSGGDGDDLLVGGPGDDVLRGGPGDDVLWGGSGDDRGEGGDGDDRCVAAGCE
ncbi:MAG: CapA family protein [Actinobacteria bacterium]|nr:CapA family protein [Actinomycetota bacterium]